jgi:hypothetical protein
VKRGRGARAHAHTRTRVSRRKKGKVKRSVDDFGGSPTAFGEGVRKKKDPRAVRRSFQRQRRRRRRLPRVFSARRSKRHYPFTARNHSSHSAFIVFAVVYSRVVSEPPPINRRSPRVSPSRDRDEAILLHSSPPPLPLHHPLPSARGTGRKRATLRTNPSFVAAESAMSQRLPTEIGGTRRNSRGLVRAGSSSGEAAIFPREIKPQRDSSGRKEDDGREERDFPRRASAERRRASVRDRRNPFFRWSP